MSHEEIKGPEKINLRLLVADDDPAILRILKLLLGRRYSSVETVVDGQALMDKFSALTFNAEFIITDNTMPGMSGIEAIRKIRETNTTIPIILYTTDTDRSLGPAARDLGAFLLSKPAEINVLYNLIDKLRIKTDDPSESESSAA